MIYESGVVVLTSKNGVRVKVPTLGAVALVGVELQVGMVNFVPMLRASLCIPFDLRISSSGIANFLARLASVSPSRVTYNTSGQVTGLGIGLVTVRDGVGMLAETWYAGVSTDVRENWKRKSDRVATKTLAAASLNIKWRAGLFVFCSVTCLIGSIETGV